MMTGNPGAPSAPKKEGKIFETNYTSAVELVKYLKSTLDFAINQPNNKNWSESTSQAKLNLSYLIWASAELNNAENFSDYENAKADIELIKKQIAEALGRFDLRM